MERIVTYVPNQQVLAADLNAVVSAGANTTNNAHNLLGRGLDFIEWMYDAATLANATPVKVDGDLDYRDRLLTAFYNIPSGADQWPGSGLDYLYDYTPALRIAYTGTGALDAGGVNAPSAGNVPAPAAGTSWAMQVAANVWLYAHPTTHELWIYNNTGGAIRAPILTIFASAKTGKRP